MPRVERGSRLGIPSWPLLARCPGPPGSRAACGLRRGPQGPASAPRREPFTRPDNARGARPATAPACRRLEAAWPAALPPLRSLCAVQARAELPVPPPNLWRLRAPRPPPSPARGVWQTPRPLLLLGPQPLRPPSPHFHGRGGRVQGSLPHGEPGAAHAGPPSVTPQVPTGQEPASAAPREACLRGRPRPRLAARRPHRAGAGPPSTSPASRPLGPGSVEVTQPLRGGTGAGGPPVLPLHPHTSHVTPSPLLSTRPPWEQHGHRTASCCVTCSLLAAMGCMVWVPRRPERAPRRGGWDGEGG